MVQLRTIQKGDLLRHQLVQGVEKNAVLLTMERGLKHPKPYWANSLIRKRFLLGPYCRAVPRAL